MRRSVLSRPSKLALAVAVAVTCCVSVRAFQRVASFGFGGDDSPANVKAEFYWSRLAFSPAMENYGGYGYWGRQAWSRDYPKADRQFLTAMHRLTRIDGRPTEQVVTLDSDEIFNYPWIYAVQVQRWSFTDAEAKRMREYLLKGGFLMVDDFHGTDDWESFMTGMRQVLPDRPIEDLQSGDEIFHTPLRRGRQDADSGRAVDPHRPHLREGWLPAQVARHPRRQGPHRRRHLPQHASRRCVGVGRRSRTTRSRSPRWRFASASTTSSTA